MEALCLRVRQAYLSAAAGRLRKSMKNRLKIYPYLLRGLRMDRPNQVWCADITFVPVRNGFLYLVAIMDWTKRKVLRWWLSNTMHADFCVDALNEAIHKFGPPEIMNTVSHMMVTSSRVVWPKQRPTRRVSFLGPVDRPGTPCGEALSRRCRVTQEEPDHLVS